MTADPTTIRELFDIPEQIRKGDFVLKLAEGIAEPARDRADLRGHAGALAGVRPGARPDRQRGA